MMHEVHNIINNDVIHYRYIYIQIKKYGSYKPKKRKQGGHKYNNKNKVPEIKNYFIIFNVFACRVLVCRGALELY